MLPPPKSRNPNIDPHAPKCTDSEHLAAWRQRMASPEGQALYTQRGATVSAPTPSCDGVDCSSSTCERAKTRAVLLWHALAHNLMRMAR